MGFSQFEGKSKGLLNKLFPTHRFRLIYLENRSRWMNFSSVLHNVVSDKQMENCKKLMYCVMYIRHTWLRKILTDVRECQKDWQCVFYQDQATSA